MTEAEAEAGSRWARWQHWCADDKPTSERAIKRAPGLERRCCWLRLVEDDSSAYRREPRGTKIALFANDSNMSSGDCTP